MVAQRSALAQALDAHRQGRLPQAESQYLQILSTDALPDALDADTRHWLGVLRLQQNRPDDARACFEQALARVPTHDAARLNLGHALRQIGDIAGAQAAFALAADAASSEVAMAAMNAWAQALAATGQHAQALQIFDRALAQPATAATTAPGPASSQPVLHEGRGIALSALGRHADAERAHRNALALRAQHAGTHNNLGLAVKAQGRLDDAIWHFRDALRINPSFVPALVNLGQSVALTGDYDQATAPLQRAVDLAPDFAPAHHELANALAALGRYDDAARHFQRAVDRDPRSALGWQNLGAVRFEMGAHDAAMTALDRALALNPKLALARFNRASLLLAAHAGREGWLAYEARHQVWRSPRTFDAIARWYGDAIDGHADAAPFSHTDRQASTGAELNTATDTMSATPSALPMFPLAGKTILLHAEQGFGDTLQFLRFVGAVAARAAHVILEVPAALLPVVAPAVTARAPSVQTVAAGQPLPDTIDCHCPLASLPLALGVSTLPSSHAWPLPYVDAPGDVPAASPQVEPQSEVAAASLKSATSLAGRLASGVTARLRRVTPPLSASPALSAAAHAAPRLPLKIGIAWSGRRAHFTVANLADAANAGDTVGVTNVAAHPRPPLPFDKRAIPLDMLMPLFALPHVEWHVMQTDIDAADRDVLAQWIDIYPIVHRSLTFTDFGDTAKAVAELDHIVSIDTSLAHLAGAMGRPVTLLLPLAADWRWSACDPTTGASAWYPSVHPIRQHHRDDWGAPVQKAAEKVMALVASALKPASSPPPATTSRKRR